MKPVDSEGAALPDTTDVHLYAPDDDAPTGMAPAIVVSLADALSDATDGYGIWTVPLRGVLDEFVREVSEGEMGRSGVAALLREYADKIDAAAVSTPAR